MAAKPGQVAHTATDRDWPWARLTATAGLFFVVLAVAGFIVRGVPPTPGAPLADARQYYLNHRTGVLTFVFLDSLAMICFVAFAAGLGGLVVRRGGDPWGILARLMLAGAIGGVGITMVLDMTEAAIAAHTAALGEPAAVQALFDLVAMVTLSTLPQAIFLVGAAAGVLRSAVAPRWLGWLALLPAVGVIVGAAGLGDPDGPVAIVGLVGGYIPMLLWMLAMSIALFVRRDDSIPVIGEPPMRVGNQQWQPVA